MRNTSGSIIIALFACLFAPSVLFGQGSDVQVATTSGGSAQTSHNEDSKVDVDMYIEWLPSGTSSLLEMNVSYGVIQQGHDSYVSVEKEDDSETGLLNNAEVFFLWKERWGTEISSGGSFHVPVPDAGAGSLPNWKRSRVYRMHDRSVNKAYKTPSLVGQNVAKYRLRYTVPEGFEMYWREAGIGAFRPGSAPPETSTLNGAPAFETAILPKNAPGALPGKVTSINSANGEMRFSLGFLTNGKSAGYLDFLHNLRYYPTREGTIVAGAFKEEATVFDPSFGEPPDVSDFKTVAFSDEVQVVYGRVTAPQCIVDIENDGFDLLVKFYHPGNMGAPFVTYTIAWEALPSVNDSANNQYGINVKYTITRTEGEGANKVECVSESIVSISVPFVPACGVITHCDACNGDGSGTCESCGGNTECPYCDNGFVECPDCEGMGCHYICSRCNGDGYNACTECFGYGKIVCGTCNGEGTAVCDTCWGEKGFWEKCPTCGDRDDNPAEQYPPEGCGQCDNGWTWEDCVACIDAEDSLKCGTCDGNKIVNCNGEGCKGGLVKCAICDGSGVGAFEEECDYCKGFRTIGCWKCLGSLICMDCGGTGLSHKSFCVVCGGHPWHMDVTDGYVARDEPQIKQINVRGFDTDFISTSTTAPSGQSFPEADIPSHNSYGYVPKGYGNLIDDEPDTVQVQPFLNYYLPKVTIAAVDNISSQSVKIYDGAFPAFNRVYMIKDGNNTPEFSFTQMTQVLTKITEGDQGLATSSTYYRFSHTNPLHDTHHGRIKARTSPDGSWTMYDYSTDLDSLGQVTTVVTPWLDSPMPANIPSSGSYCITTYTYAPDWEGVKRLPDTIIKTVDGKMVGKTVNTYSSGTITISGTTAPIWITKSMTWPSDDEEAYPLITVTKVFEGANCPSWLHGLPYSSLAPDGAKESVAYQRGTYNATTKIFTASSTGSGFRSVVIKGRSHWMGGGNFTSYEGTPVDNLYLTSNVSTAEVTIRDEYARTVRTETRMFKGGSNWELIDSADMEYDIAGNLVKRVKFNGTTYEAKYVGGRKVWEKDEQGVETVYPKHGGYDDRGRVIKTIRKGKAPYTKDLTTTFTYDNENRVLSTTQTGADGATMTTSKTYDSTGRVKTETTQDLTTTYTYAVSNGVITSSTITLPGGATRIIHNHRDGRPKSITGSAGPAEYYSYDLGSDGLTTTTKLIGSTSSPRWVKTKTDWLGRVLEQTQPAADPATNGSGNTVTHTTTYNDRGQIEKTHTTGPGVDLAPAHYLYDSNGVMNKHGISFSGSDDMHGPKDREYGFYYNYRQRSGEWWNYSETYTYPDGNPGGAADCVYQTKTWTRVTGLGVPGAHGILIAESIAQDANGNEAKTQTYLDRSSGKTTTLTYAPFASKEAIAISVDGLLVEQTSPSGVNIKYEYDGLRRPVKTIDKRTDTTTITYETNSTRIATITDPRNVVQHTYTYDKNTGRLIKDETPNGDNSATLATHYKYNNWGQLTHVWGAVPYPVRYEYDPVYGQRIKQTTFRGNDNNATATGDETTFDYDLATGVLLKRTDAQGYATEYTYTPLGQIATRKWARKNTSGARIETTYSYNRAGALVSATYNDGTPALSYDYDPLGRITTVTDVTGTRTFTYRNTDGGSHAADLKPDQEQLPAFYNNRHLANQYAPTTGRFIGLKVHNQSGSGVPPLAPNEDYSVAYTYTPADARLATIAATSGTFTYAYETYSNLISSVTSVSSVVNRTYEAKRNLLASLSTSNGSNILIAAYAYAHDALGRRKDVTQTGELYKPYTTVGQTVQTMKTDYSYNNRNEVISAETKVDTTTLQGRDFGYDFDPIGNRKTEIIGSSTNAYQTNNLNQYEQRGTPSWLPASGVVTTGTSTQIAINGTPLPSGNRLNDFFHKAENKNPSNTAHFQTISITATPSSGLSITETREALARPTTETFVYDLDGNLTEDSLWTYTYDGENRLSAMTCKVSDSTGSKTHIKFTYDYMGRRVRKAVYLDAAATNLKSCTTYLYQGWTLLCEYTSETTATNAPLTLKRRYTWGPDLSGTMGGAGDIGGLLAIEDLRTAWKGTFHPAYNGNGDLVALTEAATGNMVACYEYDPFGNLLRSSGVYAKENPIRFSGKYYDAETGLGYFGFRYYSASLGRFVNRDPLEEIGAWTLYSSLKQGADDPYAGASGVEGTSWDTEWEQAQDRLLQNTSLPHTTQRISFDGKSNSGLPGASEDNQKTYSANATGHYAQGGAPGAHPKVPSISVGNPAAGNADVNLYIYVGNNPINSIDPLGLAIVNLFDWLENSESFMNFSAIQDMSGRTAVGFHGFENGGFAKDTKYEQPLEISRIDANITKAGHKKGDEIVMYVCWGGIIINRNELKAIAKSQDSPVTVATNEIDYLTDTRFFSIKKTHQGAAVKNKGEWLVIEPDGTVRPRATREMADAAKTTADDARAKANLSKEKASEAADAVAKADKKNVRAAKRAAEKTKAIAKTDDEAAKIAERRAKWMKFEADNPLSEPQKRRP